MISAQKLIAEFITKTGKVQNEFLNKGDINILGQTGFRESLLLLQKANQFGNIMPQNIHMSQIRQKGRLMLNIDMRVVANSYLQFQRICLHKTEERQKKKDVIINAVHNREHENHVRNVLQIHTFTTFKNLVSNKT